VYEQAYRLFREGLTIHEKLEQQYIQAMDFKKADKIIQQLLHDIFDEKKQQKRQAVVYERLFGTNTADGIVNTLPNLLEPIEKKIFLHGRAGTGKSYVMNKVLEQSINYGYDAEVYRCSLDPQSIDMVIIRGLKTCVLDDTPPHETAINDERIQVIDMFKETVDQTVETSYKAEIYTLTINYKHKMQKGLAQLARLMLKPERMYVDEMQTELMAFCDEIIKLVRKNINFNS